MNSTKKIMITSVAAAFLLTSCSSNNAPVASLVPGGFSVNSKAVYLRGEMNDYEVSESYRLRKDDEDTYCTVATLRADWAPYKFKFADADWTDGSNFGYRNPPGVLHEGSAPIELSSNSKFEEVSFYPKSDGVYRFCLIKNGSSFYASVQKTSHRSLLSMSQLMKLSRAN
ncbi:pullulanase [Succinivibrio dextrinosolvens]|nr:pullulanase [Succinivibrio dextrinosolvens]